MSTLFDLLDVHTTDEHANSLAAYLPGGFIYHALRQPSSNMRNLILGLAFELARAEQEIINFSINVGASNTVALIDEWEKAVGIPDDCFDGSGTIAERRTKVLVKLASQGVQTNQDFDDLAALLGINTFILAGDDAGESRFTIVVQFDPPPAEGFPYEFPFVFGENGIDVLICLFGKLKPANCDLIFQEI
jgi:hypothetical protein